MLTMLFLLMIVTPIPSLPQITFSGKTSEDAPALKRPEPCYDEQRFCGGEREKYPSESEINAIINATILLEKFKLSRQSSSSSSYRRVPDDGDEELTNEKELVPACESRIEDFPSHVRSVNRLGQWKYIIQSSNENLQRGKIVICKKEGETCRNDSDSPHGPHTTVCRQLYRYERLLALDEHGEVSIDNFPLPSACVCNYEEKDLLLRSGSRFNSEQKTRRKQEEPILRTAKFCDDGGVLNLSRGKGITLPTEDDEVQSRSELIQEHGEEEAASFITFPEESIKIDDPAPCDNGEDFCDVPEDEESIDTVVRASKQDVVTSPTVFKQLFGQPCPDYGGIALKKGAFDVREEPLCASETKYIYPQRGRNIRGEWRNIVNTEQYQQGITMDTCITQIKGHPCTYGGLEGYNPNATTCRQQYTLHNMVVILSESRKLAVDTFRIPTACVCHLVDLNAFF